MENLSYGEADDGIEDDGHGAILDRRRLPYLVHQLSDFGTNGALHDAPHSAFWWLAELTTA